MANKKVEKKKITTDKKVEKTKEEEVKKENTTDESTNNKNGKSTAITILILGAIIIFLVALFIPGNKDKELKEDMKLTALKCDNDTDNIDSSDSKLNKISCNGYQKLVEEEKDNLILIARPTCSFCVKFIPILEEIVDEYGITINYFDTDSLSNNENSQFYKSSSLYKSDDFGTPTLIITNNNEIKKYSIGYKEKSAAIKWLKENGIITE